MKTCDELVTDQATWPCLMASSLRWKTMIPRRSRKLTSTPFETQVNHACPNGAWVYNLYIIQWFRVRRWLWNSCGCFSPTYVILICIYAYTQIGRYLLNWSHLFKLFNTTWKLRIVVYVHMINEFLSHLEIDHQTLRLG